MRRGVLALCVAAAAGSGAVALAATGDGGPGLAGKARSGSWTALRDAPEPRTEVASARIGRSIYLVGGFERNSGTTVGTLERYSIRRNCWRRLSPLPAGVNHPAAVAYRGKLYVHGGYRARRSLASATARLW